MQSETIVAENKVYEQTDRGAKEGNDLLTNWVMGIAFGRTQMDPGICFHPGSVISQTQYVCTTNMTHSRVKNAATPERRN